MSRLIFALLIIVSALSACVTEDNPFFEGKGKRPIYIGLAQLNDIRNQPPQPITLTGTIFLTDSLFFMLEQKKGIHVYRIAGNQDPQPLTFFQVPAVTDFSINGSILYADSWKDLLAINISDIYNIELLSRTRDVFKPVLSPPLYNGVFECADENKGAIIGWEDIYLDEARCQTVN